MKAFTLLFGFVLFPFLLLAQDLTNLAIDGLVKQDDGGRLTGAKVILMQDGREVDAQTSERNGRFEFFLDFGHEFTIKVSKSGFVDKLLFVNTKNVPEDEQAWGYEWPITVELFTRLPGVDYSLLDQPIGKIYYEPNVQNFVGDNAYMKRIKDDVKRLEDAQKEAIKREEDRLKRLEDDYELAIADAERAMKDEDFLMAKDNLLAAQSIKPQSAEANQLLQEVNAKLAAEGANEDKYLSALSTADQAFGNADYQGAVSGYNEALAIKPDEEYPKNRLEKSKELLAKAKAAEEAANQVAAKERQYNEAVKKGDDAFEAESFRDAKTYYQNALAIKDDPYPKARIAKADEEISRETAAAKEAEEQARIDANYAQSIDKADAAFNGGNLENAKAMYQSALSLKPDEAYPKEQLVAIVEKLQENQARKQEAQEAARIASEYTKKVSEGDKAFSAADYATATAAFEAALKLKPEEIYPAEQLAKIKQEKDRIAALNAEEAEKAEIQKEYDALITKADAYMEQEQFSNAKSGYLAAIRLKPGEAYPNDKIRFIDEQQKQESATNEANAKYDQLISKAEELYDNGELKLAIERFQEARKVKPDERRPLDRIDEINRVLQAQKQLAEEQAEEEAKQKRFKMLITDADDAFKAGDLPLALSKYKDALNIQTDEYANTQMAKVRQQLNAKEDADNRVAMEKERKRKYVAAVEKANLEMNAGNFEKARETFNLAATFANTETVHTEGLAELDRMIAEQQAEEKRLADMEAERERQAENREQFNNLMREGNVAMADEDFSDARTKFEEAQRLFPDDKSPEEKLKMLANLEKEFAERQRQEEFNKLVSKADKQFMEESLEEALENYKSARELDKSSKYVLDRIDRLNKMIADQGKKEAVEGSESHRRVVEETYDEGRTKVTIRKVIVDGKQEVYKRVIHSWGGKYYFLDDQPITELVWNRETAK